MIRLFLSLALLSGLSGALFASEAPATLAEAAPGSSAAPTKASEEEIEVLGEAMRTNGLTDLRKLEKADHFQLMLDAARNQRQDKDLRGAEMSLIHLLDGRAPEEIKRPALLELALVMQEQKAYAKAQRLYSEYVRRFAKDAAVPEVLLRQAYLYRDMGVPELALAKFFAVMSACLNLQVEEIEYYKKLVLRSQVEIAETYYIQGKFAEAAEYLNKVLKLEGAEVNRADVLYKLVRCHWNVADHNRTIANARLFLESYPDASDTPETRFLLADSLKKLGQDKEAVQEILVLLQRQQDHSKSDPQQWLYWQQRAGNDIANQFYKQGDFFKALQVYQRLAEINEAAAWQLPVWYQIGLVFENLKQYPKAGEIYDRILERYQSEAEPVRDDPTISTIAEMAAWRKKFLAWEEQAQAANKQLEAPAKSEESGVGLDSGS